jgi:glycine cleavage system regulatory protein
MNEQEVFSFSRCVYDVDNRYVDISLRKVGDEAFVLMMSDTSNDEQFDQEIDVHLTATDLKHIIEHLTKALEK